MFVLNSTLERDSTPIAESGECLVRLINDKRFPWVLVIPKSPGAKELHDLDDAVYRQAMGLVLELGKVLKSGFDADKINTAAIGNMVPQLHIHVIARRKDDACWPGPVWGVGEMQKMSEDETADRANIIRTGMNFNS